MKNNLFYCILGFILGVIVGYKTDSFFREDIDNIKETKRDYIEINNNMEI